MNEWTKSPEWLALSGAISDGGAPQSLAAVMPALISDDFRFRFARQALCFSGTGDAGCGSCASWTSDGHPDMITAGKQGEPPGIADCLDFQWRMSLKPVFAPGRLGVIMSADNLSLPAANSLLKIAEEPPAKGRILFIAERDELIPTIRSRVWMVRIDLCPGESALAPKAPPKSGAEWAEWLGATKKHTLEDVASEAGAWAHYFCAKNEWDLAASIENAVFLAKKRHFSVSMAQDALFALLMEGAGDGKIFGDLREA